MTKISKSNDQWRSDLTQERFRILRQKGTERPFTGVYNDFKDDGEFLCAGCGATLFASGTKYNSGCGWPSFTAPAFAGAVDEQRDTSHGMVRVEVTCANCDGHLGHVFPDGPAPTGARYCINSVALEFKGKAKG